MNNEYRIGAFAQVSGVSAKTLRFYDQVGLLRPTRVDPRTGYRFYRPRQLEELATIVELRDAGASLADIRRLKDRPGFENSWRQVLHDLKKATERSIEQANRSLRWIDCLLDQEEDSRRPIPVVIKRRPAVAIASIRSEVHSYGEINRLEKELREALPRPAVGELQGVLWHRCADSGGLEGEPFVALRQRVPPRGAYDLRELPAAILACAYSSMKDDSADKTYNAISRWTQIKGYRVVGPKREIYHDQVLEIQFPVGPG
jgi:DNA-binding transcriptional MerR regulator